MTLKYRGFGDVRPVLTCFEIAWSELKCYEAKIYPVSEQHYTHYLHSTVFVWSMPLLWRFVVGGCFSFCFVFLFVLFFKKEEKMLKIWSRVGFSSPSTEHILYTPKSESVTTAAITLESQITVLIKEQRPVLRCHPMMQQNSRHFKQIPGKCQ